MFFNPVQPLTQNEIDQEYADVIEKQLLEKRPYNMRKKLLNSFKSTLPDYCPVPHQEVAGRSILRDEWELNGWIGDHLLWLKGSVLDDDVVEWHDEREDLFWEIFENGHINDLDFSLQEKLESICAEKWNLEW